MTAGSRRDDATIPVVDDAFAARVLERLPHPVFVKDRGLRYVLVNRAFEDLIGIRRAELYGTTDQQHFRAREADFFAEADRGVLATGAPAVIPEEPFTDALGREHKLRTVKTPLRSEDGAITHVFGIITDLGEVRLAEIELRRAQGAADGTDPTNDAHQAILRKERLAVLGQLAGGLAHQIRNPLAAISTAAAILLKRLERATDPDVAQALTAIREEVREANRIITDLLDYARIRPPTKQRIKVTTLFDGVVDQLHMHDAVALVRDEEPGLEVVADERQLRDALGNLARNALEAMPNGGRLLLSGARDGRDVILAVEDTGPGLRRDVVGRLFEPLVTSKPLGLGLGLTLARALVENQGGVLRASTARGQGARFEVRIPYVA